MCQAIALPHTGVTVDALLFDRSFSWSLQAVDYDGNTPLIWSAREGHRGCVNILLDNEASTMTPDENGNTALHFSCQVQCSVPYEWYILLNYFKHVSCEFDQFNWSILIFANWVMLWLGVCTYVFLLEDIGQCQDPPLDSARVNRTICKKS